VDGAPYTPSPTLLFLLLLLLLERKQWQLIIGLEINVPLKWPVGAGSKLLGLMMIYHYDPRGLLGWFPKKQNPHKKMAKERELMIYHYDPSGLLGWFPKKQNPHMERAKEREFLRGDL